MTRTDRRRAHVLGLFRSSSSRIRIPFRAGSRAGSGIQVGPDSGQRSGQIRVSVRAGFGLDPKPDLSRVQAWPKLDLSWIQGGSKLDLLLGFGIVPLHTDPDLI